MVEGEKLGVDAGDFEFGQMTAETDLLVETFAAFELECHTFVAAELFYDFGGDRSACYCRGANSHGCAFAYQKNVEFGFTADFECEFFHIDFIALLDAVLFTACFDDCVAHDR